MFQENRIPKLTELNFYRPASELHAFETELFTYFDKHPPRDMKEAALKIHEITGLKRGITQVREYLKSRGLAYRKIGMIPAKADHEKQKAFLENKLNPCINEAKRGERKVFSVDAAHFVLAPFLGYLWSFTRIFIKAPAGRKRFNVLGALDIITHKLITVTNDSYINAQSVCELFENLRQEYTDIPITLILDNARYQKCKLVFEMAQEYSIDLLYLPPYSPNLQLIERLWKFVKKKCLYSIYYADFESFKNGISNCLKQTHTTYKKELDSLLTLKYQMFEQNEKVKIMPV
jgi:transposase